MEVEDHLENVFDSKNTEEDSSLKALGEDELGEHNANGSESDDKEKNDPSLRETISKSTQRRFARKKGRSRKVAKDGCGEEEEEGGEDPDWNYGNKTKPFSKLNVKEKHSTDFLGVFPSNGEDTREMKTEKLKKPPKESRTESPKRKAEEESLTNSEKKMVKFNTPRGKDKIWSQIDRFANNDQYKGSEIYTKLTAEMTRNNKYNTEDYQIDVYVCKHFKKRGWKSCPRSVRVGYSRTSSEIFVWEAADSEHQHEQDPDFDTAGNFNWTAGQAEVVRKHMHMHMRLNLILNELRVNNLVNGGGKLPTLAQVG